MNRAQLARLQRLDAAISRNTRLYKIRKCAGRAYTATLARCTRLTAAYCAELESLRQKGELV